MTVRKGRAIDDKQPEIRINVDIESFSSESRADKSLQIFGTMFVCEV